MKLAKLVVLWGGKTSAISEFYPITDGVNGLVDDMGNKLNWLTVTGYPITDGTNGLVDSEGNKLNWIEPTGLLTDGVNTLTDGNNILTY